jgi:catechol 2,3-dioxygenase-like lactoylglutathione lyase family enzyme
LTTSVRHVGIVVGDLERSLHFYRDLLGLQIERLMDESGHFVETILGLPGVRVTTAKLRGAEGPTLVELLHFREPVGVRREPMSPLTLGLTHIALTVDDVDATYQRLSKAGIAFIEAPQVSPTGLAKVAFCRDPEGTLIELVQAMNPVTA